MNEPSVNNQEEKMAAGGYAQAVSAFYVDDEMESESLRSEEEKKEDSDGLRLASNQSFSDMKEADA